MKLGYSPFTNRLTPLDEAYRLAMELKLDFIELAWDVQELDPRTQPAGAVRELARATGVGCTLHLPFVDVNLASLMPGVAANSVARVQRALDYAGEVNAIVGVLHTGF
ncbi:MAG TPA: TIM barrel protein, partial [Deinococcales bacterium]|nr:TIM barrel protein [Deinococcales bacterium]